MNTKVQSIEINGQRFVLVPAKDYDRMCRGLAEPLPPLPPADAHGNRPAREFVLASIARDIILERRALSLSQSDLAKLAGVRQETLSRIESGKHKANTRTIEKIDHALRRATARQRRAS